MIAVRDLEISFDDNVIVNRIDIDVPAGGTVVLMGKNGSGKSLILKCIAGLMFDFNGSVYINGIDTRDFYKNRESGRKHGREDIKLAYVFQKGGLFDSMNVYNNIAFGLQMLKTDISIIHEKVASSLERVGLGGSDDKLPSELSGGMQKRAGLARAICLDPDIILYDDPTAGLDPILSDSIADLMIEIKNNFKSTSLVVTHDLRVAEKIADSILLLYEGKIVFSGTGKEFFSRMDAYARQFIDGDIEGPMDIM